MPEQRPPKFTAETIRKALAKAAPAVQELAKKQRDAHASAMNQAPGLKLD